MPCCDVFFVLVLWWWLLPLPAIKLTGHTQRKHIQPTTIAGVVGVVGVVGVGGVVGSASDNVVGAETCGDLKPGKSTTTVGNHSISHMYHK